MPDFSGMTLNELIRAGGYPCACGRRHVCPMDYLNIGSGILDKVPEMIAAMHRKKPFVVCDENTWKAAGARVTEILRGAGIPYGLTVIRGKRIFPAEPEAGSLLLHFDRSCDMVLAVGSGVINDLCKVMAFAAGVPSAVVGTAPSMDGYASNSAAMEVDRVKVSLYVNGPRGILLDTSIMAQAPMRMLQAGLGDMVAKYMAICEWRISNLVTGEHYCEDTAGLMRTALRRLMDVADGIASRDEAAIGSVAEGLVLSGIAMAYNGVSRPASGTEHYFSHIWEMMALERGRPYDLHGIQVGVGSILSMKLYRKLRSLRPDRARAEAHMRAFRPAEWEAQTRRIFGRTAGDVLSIEEKAHKNDPAAHAARLDRILANWDGILRAIDEELPDYGTLRAVMERAGLPVRPSELGISVEDTVDAFRASRDIRDKYLMSSMIWDLGVMDEFAGYLAEKAEE